MRFRTAPVPLLAVLAATAAAQAPARQTESDAYTRYELLAPGSAKFRITYEVTATTAGATSYFNPIRTGSVATDEQVIDRATGRPLPFDEVGAALAREGGVRVADTSSQRYIRVRLAHPVPGNGGEARVLILKTYQDAASYFTRGDTLVFTRPLGIKRNAIVLPPDYELVSSTFPAQVLPEADGRIGISFWNDTPSEAAVTLRAVPIPAGSGARRTAAIHPDERAHQNREIVYFLQQPETHAFDLYHDYTEMRAGRNAYLNVVRTGSRVSAPRGVNLDTGEPLRTETVSGAEVRRRGLDTAGVDVGSEVVVFSYPAVAAGGSTRLRMYETYTDSARYGLAGGDLRWERTLGRPANAVVLPAGWLLATSTMPATVTTTPDGRIRLDFVNPRPDELNVLITARRR